MLDPSCAFCSIISADEPAELVARGAAWIAFFPPEPATVGHTLVVPANHVSDVWGLSPSEAGELTTGVLQIAHAIRAALAPEGLNIVQSSGKVATQTVDHLHVHLVPRMTGDAMGDIWPAKSPAMSVEDKMRALSAMRTAVNTEGQ
jgi:diadenosine tetraphosphate (Ap4A) HIT family hydrolase